MEISPHWSAADATRSFVSSLNATQHVAVFLETKEHLGHILDSGIHIDGHCRVHLVAHFVDVADEWPLQEKD